MHKSLALIGPVVHCLFQKGKLKFSNEMPNEMILYSLILPNVCKALYSESCKQVLQAYWINILCNLTMTLGNIPTG